MGAEAPATPAMPRLALVIPSLDYGGAERQVALLAVGLHRQGWPVHVVTFQPGGIFRQGLEEAGVPVVTFARGGWMGLASLAGLAGFLRQWRPQIIHSFLWSANLRARLAGMTLPDARCIISLRGFDDDLTFWHKAADRLVDARAQVVVSNCRALKEDALRRSVGRRARHEVIYNGLPDDPDDADDTTLHHSGHLGESFAVGYIGRLERKKNPLALVPVLERLAPVHDDFRGVMVGGGQLTDAVAAALAARQLSGRIQMVGYQANVKRWYSRIRVLVNTSISEGCCNVILEAMRAGVPVVATAVGGNVETVADGETGYVVPPDDPEAMAAAISRILSNPGLAADMAAAARRRAKDSFSEQAMNRAYADLYRQVDTGPAAAAPVTS